MLAEGKATHSVFPGLDIVPLGHSLQLSEPADELMVSPRHGRHCQQQGEVEDFLVPGGHCSEHSDFGGEQMESSNEVSIKIYVWFVFV